MMNTFDHPNKRLEIITNYRYSYENPEESSVYQRKDSIYQRFKLEYKPVSRELRPWREEVIETARRIHQAAGDRPLVLGMSGGIDSEVMARAFLEAGAKFSVVTLRYCDAMGGVNNHDISWAEKFCKDREIEQEIIDLDITEFFINRGEEYISQGYRSVNMFRFTQLMVLEIAEKRGAVAVMAGGEQLYYSKDNVIYLGSSPDFSVPIQWCYDRDSLHFPYFFRQNSEVFAAYMKDPLIETMLKHPKYYENPVQNQSLEKMLVYHANFLDMERRRKYHGFERIRRLRTDHQTALKTRFPDLNEKIYIPIPRIKSQLGIT